jgi:hypothetical protein
MMAAVGEEDDRKEEEGDVRELGSTEEEEKVCGASFGCPIDTTRLDRARVAVAAWGHPIDWPQ